MSEGSVTELGVDVDMAQVCQGFWSAPISNNRDDSLVSTELIFMMGPLRRVPITPESGYESPVVHDAPVGERRAFGERT